jgi:RNA polymerase sigma-70 factor (ECF subfamily)
LADDAERFEALYRQHFRGVLGYALARLEPERAKDAAAETFLVAWRRLAEVPAEPAGWLFGVARKVVAQQLRADSRRDALAVRLAAPGYWESGHPADPADEVAQRESALAALARLGERDREILTLLAWHGLTADQAAETLGLTRLTFAVRLHRARRRLASGLAAADAAHEPASTRGLESPPLARSIAVPVPAASPESAGRHADARATELDRLAAARPPLLDRTEVVVDPTAEDQILRQILTTPRPRDQARTGRPRTGRPRAIRPAAAIAAVAAVVAVAGAGVLVRSAVHRVNSPADQVNSPAPRITPLRTVAPARLPSARIMAARAVAAVAAVSRTGILDVRMVYAPGTTIGGIGVLETWSRGSWDREKLFGAGGSLQNDVSAVIARGQRVRRFVDYRTRTWQTDSIAAGQYGAGPSASQTVARLFGPARPARHSTVPGVPNLQNPRRTISSVLAMGQPMIQVTFRYPRPLGSNGLATLQPMLGDAEELPGSAGTGDSASIEVIWIDATTYLPVRVDIATAEGRIVIWETFRWLSDDAKNRAVLTPAPVPPGFRRTAELAH